MNSDKAGYRVLVSAIFYKTFDYRESGSGSSLFSCQAGIDNRSMREGKKVSFPIPDSRVIEKYKLYDMIFTFPSGEGVKDKIKINSRLYLWSGIFIGEAVVKEANV
jgi:hypothetical protein